MFFGEKTIMTKKPIETKVGNEDDQIIQKPNHGSNNWARKLVWIPVFFAVALRYLPHAFYGNVKVYPEPVPLSIIDDFLSEQDIENLQDWIKRERRFATAVEASTGGNEGYVKFMGEEVPANEQGECDQIDFYTVDGKTCGFAGRIDSFRHFATTGGFWGAKETIPKLLR